jgi:sensor histidine kinase YesM
VLVSIIAIVPLNILSFFMVRRISALYQDKLIESYNARLELYTADLDAKLAGINNTVRDYLTAARLSLLNFGPSESEAVAFTRIYEDIKRIRASVDIESVSYVRDNKTGLIAVSHSPYQYGYRELAEVKEAMSERAAYGVDSSYTLLASGGTVFLVKRYEFARFSFGLLFDAADILNGAAGILNSEQTVLKARDGRGEAELSSSGIRLTGTESAAPDSVTASLSVIEFDIVQVMPDGYAAGALPVIVKNLWIMAFVSVLALPLVWLIAAYNVLRPLKNVGYALKEIEKGNLAYRLGDRTGTFQMDYIYRAVNHMAEEIQSLIVDSYEREIEKLKTEAINLRLQIKPHMLLNCLNTISSLAQSGMNRQIIDFSMYLAKYFRYTTRQSDALTPLEKEVELAGNFIDIQKVRFPGAFEFSVTIEPGAEHFNVPPLVIVSFVENAVKHALVADRCIKISVTARLADGFLHVGIIDTGGGISPGVLERIRNGEAMRDRMGDHLGVWNSRRRLKLYYGDAAILDIQSEEGQGAYVSLIIPPESHFIKAEGRDEYIDS